MVTESCLVLRLSPVIAHAAISAYALRRLAASVASLAFSSCDVKIGMLIATNTPMIATASSSSAIMNYPAQKAGPLSIQSYILTKWQSV